MTIKNMNKNISAENEVVVIDASFSAGILTLVTKNLYNDTTDSISFDMTNFTLTLEDLQNIEGFDDVINLDNYDTSDDVTTKISSHNNNSSAHATEMAKKLNIAQGNVSEKQNKNVVTDSTGNITLEDKVSVIDNLTTNNSTKALSAKQGKILNESKVPIENNSITFFTDNTSSNEGFAIFDNLLEYNNLTSKILYNNHEIATLNDISSISSYIHPATHPASMISFTPGTELWQQLSIDNNDKVQDALDALMTFADGKANYSDVNSKANKTDVINIFMEILDENNNSTHNLTINETYTINITTKNLSGGVSKTITLSTEKGYFSEINGVELEEEETEITTTTNNNGTVTITYVASEWGYNDIKCYINGTNSSIIAEFSTQVLTTGWKEIASVYSNRIVLYSDGKNGFIKWYQEGTSTTASDSTAMPFGKWIISGSPAPSSGKGSAENKPIIQSLLFEEYAPIYRAGANYSANGGAEGIYCGWGINSSGHVNMRSWVGNATTVTIASSVYYPLKNPKW